MSDTNDTMIEHLRERLRSLEIDAAMVRARVEEVRDLLAQAERRRPGRPRKVVVDMLPQTQAPPDDGEVA